MAESDISKKMEALEVTEGSAEKKWEPMAFPEDRISFLKETFEKHPQAGDRDGEKVLEAKFVHALLFTAEERKEYSFKDFEGDLSATLPECKDELSWSGVEKFMAENL
eukprot:gb/GFBE01019487.1/.p1 GENE.gb/GFBE01019487.1/~~gb/GFBE01019487.1/.p1  ORF type:complete len:108 (+),score=40.56 gb/GFBE01019487.1/:1-324(+)